MVDANVHSESDHDSDCDTVEDDVGSHSTSADNDSDSIVGDAGTTNDATGDDDGIDADLGSNNAATTDTDGLDADVGSTSQAGEDDDYLDIDFPPDGSFAADAAALTNVPVIR